MACRSGVLRIINYTSFYLQQSMKLILMVAISLSYVQQVSAKGPTPGGDGGGDNSDPRPVFYYAIVGDAGVDPKDSTYIVNTIKLIEATRLLPTRFVLVNPDEYHDVDIWLGKSNSENSAKIRKDAKERGIDYTQGSKVLTLVTPQPKSRKILTSILWDQIALDSQGNKKPFLSFELMALLVREIYFKAPILLLGQPVDLRTSSASLVKLLHFDLEGLARERTAEYLARILSRHISSNRPEDERRVLKRLIAEESAPTGALKGSIEFLKTNTSAMCELGFVSN